TDERHTLPPAARSVGLHFDEPAALNLADAGEFASLRHALQAERALPTGPQVLFVLAPDDARDVETPRILSLFEAESRKRDGDLHRPPRLIYVTSREPARVPREIYVTPLVRNERV